jgi:hypothetical protein
MMGVAWRFSCLQRTCRGYFGWFARFVSRQLLPTVAPPSSSGSLKISLKHSMQKPHAAIFTKMVYMRSKSSGSAPSMILYAGPAVGPGCPTVGEHPCPGAVINTSSPEVGNASCVLRWYVPPTTASPQLDIPQLDQCLSIYHSVSRAHATVVAF